MPLLIVIGPSLIAPNVLLREILLTFLPEILIKSSLKVIEILVGDLVNIALLFGFEETKAVCAFAIGVASRSRPAVSAIKRFIIAKGISLRDINRPSNGASSQMRVYYLDSLEGRHSRGGLLPFIHKSKISRKIIRITRIQSVFPFTFPTSFLISGGGEDELRTPH